MYNRSSIRSVYLNLAVNTVTKLRSELPAEPGPDEPEEKTSQNVAAASGCKQKAARSHMDVIGGAKAAKTSYTVRRSKDCVVRIPDRFAGRNLVGFASKVNNSSGHNA